MNDKQKEIFDRIAEIRDRMEDAKCELALLKTACEQLKRERDAALGSVERWRNDYSVLAGSLKAVKQERSEAIQRAERAERELAELKEFAYERAPKIAAKEANKIADERDAAIQRAEKAEAELVEAQQAAEFWREQPQ